MDPHTSCTSTHCTHMHLLDTKTLKDSSICTPTHMHTHTHSDTNLLDTSTSQGSSICTPRASAAASMSKAGCTRVCVCVCHHPVCVSVCVIIQCVCVCVCVCARVCVCVSFIQCDISQTWLHGFHHHLSYMIDHKTSTNTHTNTGHAPSSPTAFCPPCPPRRPVRS